MTRRSFFAAAFLAPAVPALKITGVRRAFHNGEHNAFTGMVRFQGRFYLTFRSCPEGHMLFPSSRILLLHA